MGWAPPYTHAAATEGSYPAPAPYLPTRPPPTTHIPRGREGEFATHTPPCARGWDPEGWDGGIGAVGRGSHKPRGMPMGWRRRGRGGGSPKPRNIYAYDLKHDSKY